MARNTHCRTIFSGCDRDRSDQSDRLPCGSLRLGLSRSSALSATSRCVESTNASLPCLLWKVSRSILGFSSPIRGWIAGRIRGIQSNSSPAWLAVERSKRTTYRISQSLGINPRTNNCTQVSGTIVIIAKGTRRTTQPTRAQLSAPSASRKIGRLECISPQLSRPDPETQDSGPKSVGKQNLQVLSENLNN